MIIGLDPSFKGLGYCQVDVLNKIVSTKKLSHDIAKPSFDEICYSVDCLVRDVMKEIGGRKLKLMITETPPPTAKFSAGLYALDYAISREILHEKECPVFGVSCSYIGHLHKKKKWNKSESVKLAKEIVEKVLIPAGYNCDNVHFESNQCEALLIAMRGCMKEGMLDSLLSVNPYYKDALEFNLY